MKNKKVETFEEIVKSTCYLTQDGEDGETPDVHCSMTDVIGAMKIVHDQAVDLCMENARLDAIPFKLIPGYEQSCNCSDWRVDQLSLERVKSMIK